MDQEYVGDDISALMTAKDRMAQRDAEYLKNRMLDEIAAPSKPAAKKSKAKPKAKVSPLALSDEQFAEMALGDRNAAALLAQEEALGQKNMMALMGTTDGRDRMLAQAQQAENALGDRNVAGMATALPLTDGRDRMIAEAPAPRAFPPDSPYVKSMIARDQVAKQVAAQNPWNTLMNYFRR